MKLLRCGSIWVWPVLATVVTAMPTYSNDLLEASDVCCPYGNVQCCKNAIINYKPIQCSSDPNENKRVVSCFRRIVSERPLNQSLSCCDSVYQHGSNCHAKCVEVEMTPSLQLDERLHRLKFCEIGRSNTCIKKCQHVLPEVGEFDSSLYLSACKTRSHEEELPFE
ncbi:unnamed protein product [Bursaphelenchus xylophilus]|uniref:(pine wood nematode) hypothetical protein n=1 Tax=Bursaphelenchus xylophilus TaxID=6326 RepID=A0A1I7SX45_BURXY|nr:unnamed protein product [Bursaphelenchus xylophilus]CAG9100164.1 unnamed protein product [Bursaphelenchus xylophilus]